MKLLSILGIAVVFTAWLPSLSHACDYCIASQGISPVELGSSGIRYDFRYLHLDRLVSGSTTIANPQRMSETFVAHQFSVHYRPADALTLSLIVPICTRSSSMNAESASVQHGQNGRQQPQHGEVDHTSASQEEHLNGLADVVILGKYRFLDENDYDSDPLTLVVSAGMKLPTGKSDARNARNEFVDQHLQLGSGSTDFIAGVSLLKALDAWTIVTTFLGILPTEGTNGYKYGANLNYDLGIRYRFIEGEEIAGSFFAALSIIGEIRGKESIHGISLANSGGNTTYLAPGLVYSLSKNLSVEASYQHPVLYNFNGTQLGESRRITAAAQYLF